MSLGLLAIYAALALLALAGWAAVRPRRTAPALRRVALYHIPGPSRRPLYIGVTDDPARRAREHARTAWWWPYRTGPLTVRRWYPDEVTARAAERAAIRAEAPLYNIQHNEGRGHVLAARRMGLRHVPDPGTEPNPVAVGRAGRRFQRRDDQRRVRPNRRDPVPGRGEGLGPAGGARVAAGVPGRDRRARPAQGTS